MRSVAEAAGIGEPLLYRYYRSKRELLDAVIAYVIAEAEALDARYARVARVTSPLRRFLLDAAVVFLKHLDDMHPWYSLRLQALPLADEQRCRILETRERSFQTVARALGARGSFGDPYVTTRAFFGALVYQHMLLIRMKVETDTPELRTVFVEQVVDLFAAGA